jgi:hypothetical protein
LTARAALGLFPPGQIKIIRGKPMLTDWRFAVAAATAIEARKAVTEFLQALFKLG